MHFAKNRSEHRTLHRQKRILSVSFKQLKLTLEALHRKEQILNVLCKQPLLTQCALHRKKHILSVFYMQTKRVNPGRPSHKKQILSVPCKQKEVHIKKQISNLSCKQQSYPRTLFIPRRWCRKPPSERVMPAFFVPDLLSAWIPQSPD